MKCLDLREQRVSTARRRIDVAKPAVRGLQADAQRVGDLAPGRAVLSKSNDERHLETAQCGHRLDDRAQGSKVRLVAGVPPAKLRVVVGTASHPTIVGSGEAVVESPAKTRPAPPRTRATSQPTAPATRAAIWALSAC